MMVNNEDMSRTMKIVIIEDQTMLRETLAFLLSQESDFEIAGNWGDGESALNACRNLDINVAVVNYLLPGINGIQVTRKLLEMKPRVKVIISSCIADARVIHEAFDAGASGFIHKNTSTTELLQSIRAVMKNKRALSSNLLNTYIEFSLAAIPFQPNPAIISQEQKEILTLAAAGLSNKEISHKIQTPLSTVKLRIRTAIKALDSRDRTHAVTKAISLGLIEAPQ
jgi:DNA-binding NarL/FixJ family response regulator